MNNTVRMIGVVVIIFIIHSCSKDADNAIRDLDGNIYTSVTIGTQVWMVENLKTTKYNDGTSIPNVPDYNEWIALTTGAYCWYVNQISEDSFGALYNWYSIKTGKLCPIGWHVPSDSEWKTLTDYLGGDNIAGGKLKENGTLHWSPPNNGATDDYGFKALPGGFRDPENDFETKLVYGYWWSSTASDDATAWNRFLSSYDTYVHYGKYGNKHGFSVRCLRDE